jgi:hypothetical protein
MMVEHVKLLVIVGKHGQKALDCIAKLANRGLRGEVYLFYVENIEPYPAEFLIELEKGGYNKIKEKGMEILKELAEKINNMGLDVKMLDTYCLIAVEDILKLKKQINPDFVIIDI